MFPVRNFFVDDIANLTNSLRLNSNENNRIHQIMKMLMSRSRGVRTRIGEEK